MSALRPRGPRRVLENNAKIVFQENESEIMGCIRQIRTQLWALVNAIINNKSKI